jgi:hypothetical protein
MNRRKTIVIVSIVLAACMVAAVLLSVLLHKPDLEGELREILSRQPGAIVSLSYSRPIGMEAYSMENRADIDILFPDHHMRTENYQQMPNIFMYAGRKFTLSSSGSYSSVGPNLMRLDSVNIDEYVNLTPMRGLGSQYMSDEPVFGSGAYYYTLDYLLEEGVAEVTGKSDVDGRSCFVVEMASNTTPTHEWALYLEKEHGLPLRWIEREVYPEQYGSQGWEGDTRIAELSVNPGLSREDFEADPLTILEVDPSIANRKTIDELCLETTLEEAEALMGYRPVVPDIEGFELYGVYVRDWSDYQVRVVGFEPSQVATGVFECYLVLRDATGTMQVELMQLCEAESEGVFYSEDPYEGNRITSEEVVLNGSPVNVNTYPFYQAASFKEGNVHVKITGDLSNQGLLTVCEEMLAGGE